MKLLLVALTVFTTLAFAACGSSGGGAGVPAVVPPAGLGPIGAGVNPNQCQVGQLYSQTYGCMNQGSCPSGYGWAATVSQCQTGTAVTTQTIYGGMGSAGRFYGTMSVIDSNQFALLLKYAGLCDPYWVGWNYGTWNCETWSRSGFIQLQVFAGNSTMTSNATMFVGAGSGYGGNYTYMQYTSGYIGFSQQARLSDANNSAGMYIDGVGYSGASVGLKVIANDGNLIANPSLSTFNGDVYYQNVKFATVSFSRY